MRNAAMRADSLREQAFEMMRRVRDLFLLRQEAEATLSDPGMVRALNDLRVAALESFKNSAPGENAIRENAYWMLRALDGIEDALHNRIKEHKFIEEQQDPETSKRQSRRFAPAGD